MANELYLRIMRQGVAEWNRWRKANARRDKKLHGGDPRLVIDLRDADLHKTRLRGANLSHTDLRGINFNRSDLKWANLHYADLRGANLTDADLSNADLTHALLNDADLSQTKLCIGSLHSTDFGGAKLINADFQSACLHRVNFAHANLHRATFCNTIISECDLTGVKGLETVRHLGRSSIGLDTLVVSKGNIPEVFLRGAGVPEELITYAQSLIQKPIQFYSCFISYSSIDQVFAERIHGDLQAKGVRCWFAPEDFKIGDKLRPTIDEAIRHYDKLLLVLSENSVASDWVEHEVETAIAREAKEKRTILFPVRLDDSVMQIETGWPAHIRNTRHIGDFRCWKNHDSYQKAFDRLLRDLKSGQSKKD